MRNSVIGVTVCIILCFVSYILLAPYYIGLINWRNDSNIAQTSARNFVDMVIDNRDITDKALSDLNLSLATCSSIHTYKLYREEKVTFPSATEPGKSDVRWVYTDITEDTLWRRGDIITIVVTQKTQNLFQRISSVLLGMSYTNTEIRLSGMVR